MTSQANFSILLVDDDSLVIRMIGRMLGEFSPLRFATSGRVALKLALESVPDLVLLDVEMGEQSGFEVCKLFKSNPALASVPIVFVTSHESPELEAIGLSLGAADFIAKPPHPAVLLARVRTFQRMKMLSDTLRGTTTMDFITGAASRRQMEKTLTLECLRAVRSGSPLALLLAGIDHFAAASTELGETETDAYLRSVADVLRTAMHRPADLLGRFGAGTFALLLPETGSEGASIVARRAMDAVENLCALGASWTASGLISLSVGGSYRADLRSEAAEFGQAHVIESRLIGTSSEDVISAAEQALRSARSAGGGQAKFIDVADLLPLSAKSASLAH
ncbi:MAG: diguanylate cyclase [Steroidobacteraceae bacterium]|jgi:diguanylate cyclase (GGDEF)-like protein